MYKFSTPEKHILPSSKSEWNLFPSMTLEEIQLSDCNDTVFGICPRVNSLDECISLCETSEIEKCDGGYYIETDDGTNYCAPQAKYNVGQLYPFLRWRAKSFYPELRNVKSTIFIHGSYPYPPNISGYIFYEDNFTLRNIENNLYLNSNDEFTNLTMSESAPLFLTLFPIKLLRTQVNKFVMVRNGDDVTINVPNTSFLLRQIDEKDVTWLQRATTMLNSENAFRIYALGKKEHEPVTYTDTFYLIHDGKRILTFEKDKLELVEMLHDEAVKAKLNIYFRLEPKVEVNYCDGETCKKTTLEQCKLGEDGSATFNGNIVYRTPECLGLCEKKQGSSLLLIVLLVLLLSIGLYFILKRIRS